MHFAQLDCSTSASASPLIAKLEKVTELSDDDRSAIEDLCRDVRDMPFGRDVIREGDRPDHVHLVIEGWAARYKIVGSGARQITAFLIPGDFCDLHVTILCAMDHGITTLTPARVAMISHDRMEALTRDRPALTRALWWATLVDEAVLRSWIVTLGRRDAYQGIAHLMCEMHMRMDAIGLVTGDCMHFPLTQEELADTLGLTPVHINRVLQRLRAEGLITFRDQFLTIHDLPALRRVAEFDSNYLHTRQIPRC